MGHILAFFWIMVSMAGFDNSWELENMAAHMNEVFVHATTSPATNTLVALTNNVTMEGYYSDSGTSFSAFEFKNFWHVLCCCPRWFKV